LYALILLPIFAGTFILARHLRKKALTRFGDINLIVKLFPDTSDLKPIIKFVLLITSLVFIVLGMANLQVGTKIEEVKREGVDVMIALDVSRSMNADDIKPSRLERARQAVSRLIDNLQNDRIGLIAFAGDAYLQLPLTSDFSAAKLFLSTVNTDIVPKQGTAIGAAIRLAMESYPPEDELHKVLIVITDGENHEDDAIGAADEAAKQGVIVHTIGMGTVEGGPIPVLRKGQRVDFARDRDGSVIVTKLDPGMLEQIAASSNGKFILASGADPDLTGLLDEIGGMEKKEFGSKLFTDYESRFQYFFGAALLLLIIELILSGRKNRFVSALNLFGDKK
ncbi:VWA domain-containing protein, partial [Bacteroidota bacterium]